MPTFEELLAQLREPGEDGIAPSIYDDLSGAYTSLQQGSEARLAAEQAERERLASENSSLKAANYDLLMATSASVSDTHVEEQDDSESFSGGIDDLFK
jgi:hypothetical protein